MDESAKSVLNDIATMLNSNINNKLTIELANGIFASISNSIYESLKDHKNTNDSKDKE